LKEVSALFQSANSKLPAFAIGGVDLSNLSQLIDCGFRRVAVSKAVWEAELPARAAESMLLKLNQVG
jgi:thiamine-phosphate pyrophosphorylase